MRSLRNPKVWVWGAIASTGLLAVAVGVAAPPLTEGLRNVTPPSAELASTTRFLTAEKTKAGARSDFRRVTAGNGIPVGLELPVGPPLRADYRKVPTTAELDWESGSLAIGPRVMPRQPIASEAGGVAATVVCTAATQCSDCNPCTFDDCDSGKCTHLALGGSSPAGCDDGIGCNGKETCVGAVCTPGTAPICTTTGYLCNEDPEDVSGYACKPPCTVDGDCDGGLCATGSCDTGAGGICLYSNKCGPGGTCNEAEGTCSEGRCCVSNVCSSATFPVCAGDWLATDEACAELPASGATNDCPEYGGGIAPQGAFGAAAGPISTLPCDSGTGWTDIGDDYETANHGTGSGFMQVELLRFAGGVIPDVAARWVVAFYDESGILIEDVFWPDGSDAVSGDPAIEYMINTIDFAPPLEIPTKGFVVFSIQPNFSPDGRTMLLSTTEAADVGVNDPNRMWANGGPIEVGDPGPLPAGSRRLAFEIVGTPLDGPPLGACCTGTEEGVCNDKLPWICEAPIAMGGLGGHSQGVGYVCESCSSNPLLPCTDATQCPMGCSNAPQACAFCDEDGPADTPCNNDGDCVGSCVPDAANCPSGETCDAPVCYAIFPVCTKSGCCDPADGVCTEVSSPAGCPDPKVFQGYGTGCDADVGRDTAEQHCCPKPVPTGGDSCDDIIQAGITQIEIPAVGDPAVTVTFTGNNSAATFSDWPTWTDSSICNVGGSNSGPCWWEGFELLDPTGVNCANVRVDLCCSSENGEPVRPQWGGIWRGCPALDINTRGSTGVDEPFGDGRGTEGFARGAPFCGSDDNLWETYALLRPDIYFKTIYSSPDGTYASPPGGEYQMHITVQACPLASCCKGDQCEILTELDCMEQGGYWLSGVNVPGDPVVTCDPIYGGPPADLNVCELGSCCRGEGVCEDSVVEKVVCDPGSPTTCMDLELCTALGADYIGGALCDYPIAPCPVCEIEGAANCQKPDLTDDSLAAMSDLSAPPNGIVTADDFFPTTSSISKVCTWGMYQPLNDSSGSSGSDCQDQVDDNFRIRVYEDNNGLPAATPVGESFVSSTIKGIAPETSPYASGWVTYAHQLTLETPITGLNTSGQRYWLEIANNTTIAGSDPPEADKVCMWHWRMTPNRTNSYMVTGSGSTYPVASWKWGDLAFCLDQTITPATDVLGECYDCAGGHTETTLMGCQPEGKWNDPDPGVVHADECVDAIALVGDAVTVGVDTTCATESGGVLGFGPDVWYSYVASCTGRVSVNMCATGNMDNSFDSMLAVHRNTANPKVCACPGDLGFTDVGKNQWDEGCNGLGDAGSGFYTLPPVEKGDCIMIRVGGFEGQYGPAVLTVGCSEASCPLSDSPVPNPKMVDAGYGVSPRFLSFHAGDPGQEQAIRVIFPSSMPAPYGAWDALEMWVGPPKRYCENSGNMAAGSDVPPTFGCDAAPGLEERTYMASMLQCEAFYRDWHGFCDPTGTQCVAPSVNFGNACTENVDCDTGGGGNGVCSTVCLGGLRENLACTQTADCSGPIYVYHEGIIPSTGPHNSPDMVDTAYTVQVIDLNCLDSDPESYSDPLDVVTSKWGDTVENTVYPFPAPEGIIQITDVLAILQKFQNLGTATISARVDLMGATNPKYIVDHQIDIGDVLQALFAFQAVKYPSPAITGVPSPRPGPPCP